MSVVVVRIRVGVNNAEQFIEVDGVRLKGVRAVRVSARVRGVPIVTVEFNAPLVEIEAPHATVKRTTTKRSRQ